jgi:hypothetical protein
VWEGNDGGGINRLKYHLAQIPGHEVEICPDASPKIIHIANQITCRYGYKRDYKEVVRIELAAEELQDPGERTDSSVSSASPSTMPSSDLIFFCS